MDGREMIYWLLLLELSVLAAQPFDNNDNNRPVDHQRKILVRMVWPGGHTVTPPSEDDTTPIPVVIPAASFSRQMIIRFPSSGSISSAEQKQQSFQAISSAGYDPPTTEESADYSLDSYVSLSLSSGGSDAEGADQNLHRSRNEKSYDGNNSKLDLLQQLLRLAPSSVENGNYDKCNHPFHSWICSNNNNKEIARSTTPQPTTTIQQQAEYFPISSFEHVQILIPDLSPTVVPPLPAPPTPVEERIEVVDSWAGLDPCSHPFHSWMCKKPKIIQPPPPPSEFKETGASVLDENLLLPSVEPSTTTSTTTPAPTVPPTTKRSSWDGADPCTHPFHSWLCGKRQPAARTTTSPPPTTTTPQPFIPDASFFIPDLNPAPIPTTTQPPPPTTTLPPLIIRTLAPKKGWDEADSCSHPFHSWLCEKPKVRTTPPPTIPPPLITTPIPTTTTTPPPPPPPEETVIFETAPSIDEGNQLVPDVSPPPPITTAKPTKSSGWDEADSCSHPFHSWLCAKPQAKQPRTTRPPPTTTTPLPAADIQLPEAASNFETQDAIPLPPPEITTYRPAVKIIPTQSSGWAEDADPCSHPFHSWLCAPKPPAKARTTRPPPTTTLPPPADIQLPDASNFGPQDAIPLPSPVVIPTPAAVVIPTSGWAEGADPCTHPFHSWLCNRSPSATKQNLELGSNLRVGRQSSFQSEVEAQAEETVESSRWNKFESLRLLPSGVRQRK